MSYKVVSTRNFEKELKALSKKYPSLKTEFPELVESLAVSPMQGTALGKGCYKIRFSHAIKR